jgi:hypothetical protein
MSTWKCDWCWRDNNKQDTNCEHCGRDIEAPPWRGIGARAGKKGKP